MVKSNNHNSGSNTIKAKSYSNEFKFKVALELLKGDLTIAEVVSRYQVPRSVATRWKKQLLDNGSEVFKAEKQASNNTHDAELEKLHATIGRLKVENDFLVDVSRRLKL